MKRAENGIPRLVAIDRRQMLLRTVDVEKLVEEEHCVRSIWDLVGRLDLRLYYAQIAGRVARAQWGETNLGALPSVLEGGAFDFS